MLFWVKWCWTWSIIPASNEPPIRGNQSENRVGREEGGGQSDYIRKGSYTAVRREEGSQTIVRREEDSKTTAMRDEGSLSTVRREEGSHNTAMREEGSYTTVRRKLESS